MSEMNDIQMIDEETTKAAQHLIECGWELVYSPQHEGESPSRGFDWVGRMPGQKQLRRMRSEFLRDVARPVKVPEEDA